MKKIKGRSVYLGCLHCPARCRRTPRAKKVEILSHRQIVCSRWINQLIVRCLTQRNNMHHTSHPLSAARISTNLCKSTAPSSGSCHLKAILHKLMSTREKCKEIYKIQICLAVVFKRRKLCKPTYPVWLSCRQSLNLRSNEQIGQCLPALR